MTAPSASSRHASASETTQAYLAVNNMHAHYGESYIVQGITLAVNEGEILALLGRNGAGKTTTLRTIARLDDPQLTQGELWLDGQRIDSMSSHQAAVAGIGLVPEDRRIIAGLTVEENLQLAQIAEPVGWSLSRIYDLFPRLEERRKQEGITLSGGEQQMLAIGRALMTNPKLMILDEATEGLAPLVRDEIWSCLEYNLKQSGQAILVIDKHPEAMARIADRHFVMEKGKIAWSGTSQELLANAEMQHQFLGV